jgi:hypothetical protein
MTVHQIQSKAQFASYLVANPPEIRSLFEELIIEVTSFFSKS